MGELLEDVQVRVLHKPQDASRKVENSRSDACMYLDLVLNAENERVRGICERKLSVLEARAVGDLQLTTELRT